MRGPHVRPRAVPSPADTPDGTEPDGLRRPSTKRLVFIATLTLLSVLMGQNLMSPVVTGWRRAEEALALQDQIDGLRQRHVQLQQDIQYRQTPAGKALTSAEILVLTHKGARVVELVPREQAAGNVAPPTLSDRVKGWREKGRICVYHTRRVLALYLFDRWLPPGPVT